MNNRVVEFVAEARRFCAFIEGVNIRRDSAFAKECLIVLLHLYQQVLLLPDNDPCEPERCVRIPHEEWQAIRERAGDRIEHDYYWEVFEPFAENRPNPIYGSISDDLADIWHDLKTGLHDS